MLRMGSRVVADWPAPLNPSISEYENRTPLCADFGEQASRADAPQLRP